MTFVAIQLTLMKSCLLSWNRDRIFAQLRWKTIAQTRQLNFRYVYAKNYFFDGFDKMAKNTKTNDGEMEKVRHQTNTKILAINCIRKCKKKQRKERKEHVKSFNILFYGRFFIARLHKHFHLKLNKNLWCKKKFLFSVEKKAHLKQLNWNDRKWQTEFDHTKMGKIVS